MVIIYDTTNGSVSSEVGSSFQYDNNGREASATEDDTTFLNGQSSILDNAFTFTYATGIEKESGTSGTIDVASTYYINGDGTEMDSAVIVETSGGAPFSVLLTRYTYNSSGLCTEADNTETFSGAPTESFQVTYTYSGKDVVKAVTTEMVLGTAIISTDTYAYNGTTGNVDADGVSFLPIFFHQTFDLPASATLAGWTKEYTYTFDSQHRVTGITATTSTGKLYLRETITY